MKKLNKSTVEKLACEIREFLISNDLWSDCTIYFNGKAFSTDDRQGNFYYNNRKQLVVLEDQDPRNYFEYVAEPHTLSMSFEGDFYGCLNYTNEYGAEFDNRIMEEFSTILEKHGLYYELGNAWNLSCYSV